MNKQHIIGLVLFVFGAVTTVNATFVQSAIGNLPSAAEKMGEQMAAHLPQECPNLSEELDVGFVVRWLVGSEIEEGEQKFAEVCEGFVTKVKEIPTQVKESVKGQISGVHGTLSALIAAGLLSLVVGFALLWRKPYNAV